MKTNSKIVPSNPTIIRSKSESKPASKGPSQVQSKKILNDKIMELKGKEIKDAL